MEENPYPFLYVPGAEMPITNLLTLTNWRFRNDPDINDVFQAIQLFKVNITRPNIPINVARNTFDMLEFIITTYGENHDITEFIEYGEFFTQLRERSDRLDDEGSEYTAIRTLSEANFKTNDIMRIAIKIRDGEYESSGDSNANSDSNS